MSTNPPRLRRSRATLMPPAGVRRSFTAEGLVDIAAAVELFAVSEARLWGLIRARKITSGIPEGTRRRLISVASLRAYLDATTPWDEGSY